MATKSCIFWLPRRGSSPAEYEDACAANDAAGRYAVADGASEGCFTDLWARLLVKDFVDRANCPAGEWPVSLSEAQSQWDTDVRSREIAWHTEPWVQQGACAAFLGISLTDSPRPLDADRTEAPECLGEGLGTTVSPLLPGEGPGATVSPRLPGEGTGATVSPRPYSGEGQGVRAPYHWQAVAVGDTCLFHTRDRVMLRAFPLERAEQFNSAPNLVGARMSLEQIHKKRVSWTNGQGRPGDRLWAMTDALAQWCLAEVEADRNPWAELESLVSRLPSPSGGGGGETNLPSPVLGRGAGGEGLVLPSPSESGAGGEDTILPSSACGRGDEGESVSDSFAPWIDGLRQSRRLRNDDVTLLAILL